jgi:hypothetical protein
MTLRMKSPVNNLVIIGLNRDTIGRNVLSLQSEPNTFQNGLSRGTIAGAASVVEGRDEGMEVTGICSCGPDGVLWAPSTPLVFAVFD